MTAQISLLPLWHSNILISAKKIKIFLKADMQQDDAEYLMFLEEKSH